MFVPFSVSDFIDRAARVYADRVGVVDEPDQPAPSLGELTYREFAGLAARQAAHLDELGIGVGERVAVVSHNSARLLTSFFGVAGTGRVLVPINFRLRPDEVRYIVEHSGARALYVDPALEEELGAVTAEHRYTLGQDEDLYAPAGAEPRAWQPDENATACINYTSGTTARPKGVQITHRNIWVNALTFGLHAGLTDRDVYLHTLPMFHANGWGMPFATTGLGIKQVVLRKVDGAEILRRVRDHGVTVMCAAPAVVAAVLDAARDWEGQIPGRGSVRIIVAGAPPPTRTVARVEEELGWEFVQIYGLTETSPLLTINRSRSEWDDLATEERAAKLVRAGAPALGVRLGVSTEEDNEGEILARSNVVLDSYWQQPEETAAVLRDGWFHTGDGGTIGEDGYLTISDRKKDVIITGGENVSSIEVEDVLFSHPAVSEVAVIGVPSDKWGETIKALVVLAPETEEPTEGELIAWCKQRAAGYKAPTSVEFRDELSRTATGKLQKFKLRAPYWTGA
ncbi:Acyl-CoA synthetase (AMP-forming)/AMP-acid ligase II [Actinopolyspora lacussalsi subsp. righensis]|uniref:Acyl-CoA synthetase (AMP-forming)/AMP-acid ligase II n=1 Tax=Actinopolyspora righensis TaxID=995060 RepID=A0A1I6X1T2_9ACTN|nr:AMP-binding protein [Actinopolyspora righensis]SFT32273.1 Acyl-CoA synthetase (AMP-forming)/AMP-acid ligase II [Actinopolyspora righensis]